MCVDQALSQTGPEEMKHRPPTRQSLGTLGHKLLPPQRAELAGWRLDHAADHTGQREQRPHLDTHTHTIEWDHLNFETTPYTGFTVND